MPTEPDPLEWEPYCGAEYRSGEIAGGGPVTCVRNAHGPDTQHRAENGWEWW